MKDFDKILSQWDAVSKKIPRAFDAKKAEREWLDTYGTVDKDEIAGRAQDAAQQRNPAYLKRLAPEDTLDLHGLTKEEAWRALEIFVERSRARRLRKVLIIHGKGIHTKDGEGVLGETVRLFIEQNKHLGASGHPGKELGGSGATWVIIKN